MELKNKSFSFKVGLGLAILHFSLVIFTFFGAGRSVFNLLPLLFLDAYLMPLFLLFRPITNSLIFQIFVFDILGTLSWFFIPILMAKICNTFFSELKGALRILVVVVMIVVLRLFLSFCLTSWSEVGLFMDTPYEARKVGVKKGADFLKESIFLKDSRLGTICDIVQGQLNLNAGSEIGVTTYSRVFFLDREANIRSFMAFNPTAQLKIIDLENDGNCEYLATRIYEGISLIDHQGNVLWEYNQKIYDLPRYPRGSSIDRAIAGNIGRTGIWKFAVLYHWTGISLIDKYGVKNWEQLISGADSVQFVDVHNDGNVNIVIGSSQKITIMDSEGKIVSQKNAPYQWYELSICKWPTKNDQDLVLFSGDKIIHLIDFDGNSIMQFSAPGCTTGPVKGVLVKLKIGEPEYLAVLAELFPTRWALYVYDPQGTLVYQRVFSEQCSSIAAVSLDDSGAETLLVGSVGKIWQYR